MQRDPIQDFFSTEHPNPARDGCPAADVLRAIARNRLPASDPARLHLAGCSPCFSEFREMKEAVRLETQRRRKTMVIGAIAASLLIAFSVVVYNYLSRPGSQTPKFVAHNENPPALESATLDFSDDLPRRATTETPRIVQTLRTSVRIVILTLPVGSQPGDYDVEIRQESARGAVIKVLRGVAAQDSDAHIKLRFDLGVPSLVAGSYILTWRLHGTEFWSSRTFSVS
jgi:hypothetical protein